MRVTGAVIPFRQHTLPTGLAAPAPTQTAQQVPGLALHAMWAKNNGDGAATAYHDCADPCGTITSRDSTSLVAAQTAGGGPLELDIDDVHFRMLTVPEVQAIMAYDRGYRFAHPDPEREPSVRDKIRLLGDGVTPPVLAWLTERTLAILDQDHAA